MKYNSVSHCDSMLQKKKNIRHALYRSIVKKYSRPKYIQWRYLSKKHIPIREVETIFPWSHEQLPIQLFLWTKYNTYTESMRQHIFKKHENILHSSIGFSHVCTWIDKMCLHLTDVQWKSLGVVIEEETTIQEVKFLANGSSTFVMHVQLQHPSTSFVIKVVNSEMGEIKNLLALIEWPTCLHRIPKTMHHAFSYTPDISMTVLFQEYTPSMSNVLQGAQLFRQMISTRESFVQWINALIDLIRDLRSLQLVYGDFKLENIGVRYHKDHPFQLVLLDVGLIHSFVHAKKIVQTTAESQWPVPYSANPFVKDCSGLFSIMYATIRLLLLIRNGNQANNYEMYHYIRDYIANKIPHLSAMRLLYMFFANMHPDPSKAPKDDDGKGWVHIEHSADRKLLHRGMGVGFYRSTIRIAETSFETDIPETLFDHIGLAYPELRSVSKNEIQGFIYRSMQVMSMKQQNKHAPEFSFKLDREVFTVDHNLLYLLKQEHVITLEQEEEYLQYMVKTCSAWSKIRDATTQDAFLECMKEWMCYIYDCIILSSPSAYFD